MHIKPEDIEYRGYILCVIHHPPMWQVGIYPSKMGMVERDPSETFPQDLDRNKAIEKAKACVDTILDKGISGDVS